MTSPMNLRSVAQQLYVRALSTAWRNRVQLYDPSQWLIREPELEEKALRDADIAHAVGYRRHLIAGKNWQVTASNPNSKRGQLTAHVAEGLLRHIKHFTQARMNLARAFFSGSRFGEIVLERRTLAIGDGKPRTWAVPVAIKDMDKMRFRIVPTEKDGVIKAHWQVFDLAKGDWCDQTIDGYRRTIRHVYADDEATLGHGRGLREALGWWWYAKEHVFHESLGAVEKFARGILSAKVRGVRDAETGLPNSTLIAEWQAVLEDMQARNVLVYDSEDTVEMVRMDGTGWQLMSTIRGELRSAIFTLILGANLTTSAESGGSYALAEIQENSTEALIQFDREALEETLTDDLIGCLWYFNAGNIADLGLDNEPIPRFKITQEKKNDPKQRMDVASVMHQMGVSLPLRDLYEQSGFRMPEPGEPLIEGIKPQPPGGPEGQPPQSVPGGGSRPLPFVRMPDDAEEFPDPRGGSSAEERFSRQQFAASWDESQHPRGRGGRFISKGEIEAARSDPTVAASLRAEVKDPEEQRKLEAAIGGKGYPRGPTEGHKPNDWITTEALTEFARREDGGAEPDEELQGALVPKDVSPIAELHAKNMATVAKEMGLESEPGETPPNSSKTIDALLADAQSVGPTFNKMLRDAAGESGGKAWFGKDDQFMLKSRESMTRKVKDRKADRGDSVTEEDVVGGISDAVRGSIIFNKPQEITRAVEAMKAKIKAAGGSVYIDNKFSSPNASGYAGVHMGVNLPTPSGGTIQTEVQFHLASMYDGTMGSAKEKSHGVYEIVRKSKDDKLIRKANAAMMLYFAAALQHHFGGSKA